MGGITREPAEYTVPRCCEECGSTNISVRVIWESGITRYICLDCGFARSLPKESNLKRRTNTTQSNWAKQVIASSPSCKICGSNKNLEAHHIIPVANSGKYRYIYSNGVTLCHDCHYLVHHKEDER